MSIPPELQQDDIAAVIITSSRMAPELRERLKSDGVDLDDMDFLVLCERSDWDDDTGDFSGFGACSELWRLFAGYPQWQRDAHAVLGGEYMAIVQRH